MLVASVSSSFTTAVANHGAYAVFGLLALGAILPVGSELVALVGGAVAAGVFARSSVVVFGAHIGVGAGAVVALALAATLGYLAGSIVGWTIGRFGGRELLERRGRWLHVTPERLDRADTWFSRWDKPGVLVGTLTPVLRSFIAIPAGIFEMPLAPFLGLALVGSALWSFAFVGAGYGLGASYKRFDHAFHYVEYAVIAGVLLFAAYLVYRWRAAAKVTPHADDPAR
ncbi:MAG TPA: DedA family protein [Gaiellaceae bacterium]|nr:DedA family protein [Gaiellaceae bacterium]